MGGKRRKRKGEMNKWEGKDKKEKTRNERIEGKETIKEENSRKRKEKTQKLIQNRK